DDVFEVDAGDACVGEERVEVGFAFVVFVLGDAAVVHRVFETEPHQHLRLRQAKRFTNLAQLTRQTFGTRARVSHQERPPDGSDDRPCDMREQRFCLRSFPVGSSMRSLSIFAVVVNLSYQTAMLITRHCGSLSWACGGLIVKDECNRKASRENRK